MDFLEKAGIRIQHWIRHNEDHLKEYESFADELDAAGQHSSAEQVRKMAVLSAEGNECLHRASRILGTVEQEESHV
jgi:signal-transduction protein with cAMP-binding, CBS, and nucleotidyltransferase domain